MLQHLQHLIWKYHKTFALPLNCIHNSELYTLVIYNKFHSIYKDPVIVKALLQGVHCSSIDEEDPIYAVFSFKTLTGAVIKLRGSDYLNIWALGMPTIAR
jgi:hypothetical protein